METLNRPLRYGLVGAAAGLVGWWLSKSLGTDPNTAWWIITMAGGASGVAAGLMRHQRDD